MDSIASRLTQQFQQDDDENAGKHSTFSKHAVPNLFFVTDEGGYWWLPQGTLGAQLIGSYPPGQVSFHFTTDDQTAYRLTLVGANPDDFAKMLKRFAEGRQWVLLPKSDGIASITCVAL